MIARVLTQQPEVILFDEPTNHLDYGNQHRTIDMIKSLSDSSRMIIMTTHNPEHALRIGGKAAILRRNGELVCGDTERVLSEKALSELYRLEIGVSYFEGAGRTICYAK